MRINGKVSYFELEQLIFIFKNSLVNSYLKKIYHYNKLFMFKFNHISFVYDRNYLWTGGFSEREDGRKLHSLSTKLRKEIGDKRLLSIDIFDNNDKTVILKFNERKLIFEFYDQGNIILLNNDNKIVKVFREIKKKNESTYVREHGMLYPMKDFKVYDDKYKIVKFGWKIKDKEIIAFENDFDNVSDALSHLWELKKVNKENKKLKSNKKKLTPEDHLKKQKENLGKKINKKLEEVKKLEDVPYESIDYAKLNKIHTQRKKLESKLKKASQVIIPQKMNKVTKSDKIELVTTFWYQKYHWWYTKNGFLVVGGKNADDNEKIVSTYLKDNDYYLHTDEAGSGSFVLITEKKIPEDIDFTETAEGVLALSTQWDSSFISGKVYYVKGEQVTKTPESGEYVTKGSFIIRGNKNYINISECKLGYGLYNNNQLMLAPYGIINRLKGSKVQIIHSTKKMKGKIFSKFIKKKLNIKLPDSISLFSKPCKIK